MCLYDVKTSVNGQTTSPECDELSVWFATKLILWRMTLSTLCAPHRLTVSMFYWSNIHIPECGMHLIQRLGCWPSNGYYDRYEKHEVRKKLPYAKTVKEHQSALAREQPNLYGSQPPAWCTCCMNEVRLCFCTKWTVNNCLLDVH